MQTVALAWALGPPLQVTTNADNPRVSVPWGINGRFR